MTVFARGPEDPHFVEAKPGFIKILSQADLLIEIGMDLEVGWLPVLAKECSEQQSPDRGQWRSGCFKSHNPNGCTYGSGRSFHGGCAPGRKSTLPAGPVERTQGGPPDQGQADRAAAPTGSTFQGPVRVFSKEEWEWPWSGKNSPQNMISRSWRIVPIRQARSLSQGAEGRKPLGWLAWRNAALLRNKGGWRSQSVALFHQPIWNFRSLDFWSLSRESPRPPNTSATWLP